LDVDFTWKKKHRCSAESPELKLEGIPADTVELRITMIDHDMRSYDHGGGSVRDQAGFPSSYTVNEGALKSYKGPCPPHSSHDYEFIVVALDKAKNAIGKGSKKKTFPPKEGKE
jgi:phosphatidylethanolamine-binding protein (PEBP) family uncharacterized protein